jgi:hypothetical protein
MKLAHRKRTKHRRAGLTNDDKSRSLRLGAATIWDWTVLCGVSWALQVLSGVPGLHPVTPVMTATQVPSKESLLSRVLEAHTCNPSYSGGRDQEDQGSKPAGQIVLETLSQKTLHKKGLVEWLVVSSNPSTARVPHFWL